MQLSIPTPRTFSFKRTVISHGWCELLPYEIDRDSWKLTRTLDLADGAPVTVDITANRRNVQIDSHRTLGKKAVDQVLRDVRHMLRLDDDMSAFYETMKATPDFEWVSEQGAGRLLRGPTVFEDLVKMICTTNCSWSLTKKMVTGLVQSLGRESAGGHRTFPTPEAMALMPTKFYVNEVRAGYRAPYLKELADRVASSALNVEAWLVSPLPTKELIKEMKSVKGVGDYAAENVLKLLGRYDGLALDSWTRAKFCEVHNNGRKATDKKIARHYSGFKEWRGLALWCDLTRDWLDVDGRAAD
jgi:3-methyladenine DNA glycosylase/8-oxoguanine DNA glycosylase